MLGPIASTAFTAATPTRARRRRRFRPSLPSGTARVLTASQSVGLACGSIWKATLASTNQSVLGISAGGGSATAYNTVAAYNYGGACSALPILDGSAIIPNSAFTAVGGSYPNLYYAGASFTGSGLGTTLTVSSSGLAGVIEPGYTLAGSACVPPATVILSGPSGGGAGTYVTSAATTCSSASLTASPTFPALAANKIFVWETGAPGDDPTGQFMSLQTTESGANSAAGSYYIAGYSSGFSTNTPPTSGFVYVHPYDGSNAITNGYIYEVSMQIPFTSNTLFDHVTGIEGRKTGSNTGVFNFEGPGGSVQLNNCIARDGGRHSALLESGSTVSNCVFVNGYDNESSIGDNFLVFHESSTGAIGALPLTVNNSVFQQSQVISGNGSATGIISHTDDTTLMGNVSLNDDWFIAKNGTVLEGFGFANVGAVIVNRQYGSQIGSLDSIYQNTAVTNSQVVTAASANDIFLFSTNGTTLTVDNSKFCGTNMGQGVFRWVSSNNNTLNLTNSLVYGRYPNAANPTLQFNGGSGTTYYFYGDDFGSNVQYWSPLEDQGSGNIYSTASDYNIYESQGGYAPQWFLNSTNKSTLPTWQSLTSADSHSTENGGAAAIACELPDSMPEVQ